MEINHILNFDSMPTKNLETQMDKDCEELGRQMYCLTKNVNKVTDILNSSYYRDDRKNINYETNFDEIERFEYELDELFENFKKIKSYIKYVRVGKLILNEKKRVNENENSVIYNSQ